MTRRLLSVALLSLAIIAFQLFLMQIFSYLQWYHFASLVVAVALLGFGASGTFLSLFRERLVRRADRIVPGCMLISGLSMGVSPFLAQWGPFRFDSFLMFHEVSQVLALGLTCLLLAIPFFTGALVIALLLLEDVEKAGPIYAASFLGSAAGSVVGMALLWMLLPRDLPFLPAILCVLAALTARRASAWRFLLGPLCVSLVLLALLWHHAPPLRPSEYKGLSRTLLVPGARITLERASPYGIAQVVTAPSLRYAPGLSLTYDDSLTVCDAVFNNGDWYGPLGGGASSQPMRMLDYTTLALPYSLGLHRRVLVLDAGTGMQLRHAVHHGAEEVTGYDVHAGIVDLLGGDLAYATDSVALRPGVRLHSGEPRMHLPSDTSRYDLILLPLLGAFGGTSGLHAMKEHYSLTREAFMTYWDRLRDSGIVSVSAWTDYPVRNPLKILGTLTEMLEREGVASPRAHIAAARSWGTVTFAVKRTPLTADDIRQVQEFCERMGFDVALLPGVRNEEKMRHNRLQDARVFALMDSLVSGDREGIYRDYEFNIRPATDDSPFFSQYLRWQSLPWLVKILGVEGLPYMEVGYSVVLLTLLLVCLLASILIILPLLFRVGPPEGSGYVFLYFGGIGLGYMFVEMALLQRGVLYVGSTILSAAIVIGGLLLWSGIGSLLSSRLAAQRFVLWRTSLVAAVLVLATALLWGSVMTWTESFPLPGRAVVMAFLAAPAGIAMGMPFPLGLRYFSSCGPGSLAWAWGVNGSLSVMSSVLATVIAVEAGFTAVLIAAAVAYGCSVVAGITYSPAGGQRVIA